MAGLDEAYALVIGIAAYRAVAPLPPVVCNDARDVADTLGDRSLCAYGTTPVLLLDSDATKSSIVKALERLAADVGGKSHVFVYFSGHGYSVEDDAGSTEYLLPYDADLASPESLRATAISGNDFQSALGAIRAKTLLVVLDCCHSGGIGEPKGVRPDGPPKRPWWKEVRGLPDSYYDALGEGSRVILAACRGNEFSWTDPGGRNSLFTGCLLEGLRGGVESSDGFIRVFHLFDYVKQEVTKRRDSQHPFFKSAVEDDFPVALRLGGTSSPRSEAPGGAASPLDGLLAFLDLVRTDPDIRGSVSAYRSQFLTICENIKEITNYKRLHDQFQQLEDYHSLIGISVGADVVDWRALGLLSRLTADSAEEVLKAAQVCDPAPGARPLWQKTLKSAMGAIAEAIAQTDRDALTIASRDLSGVFAQGPSRANDRMIAAARLLRLQPLRDALRAVQDRLRARADARKVNAAQVRVFAESVDMLGTQENVLQRLLAVHQQMQEADGILRSIEPFVHRIEDVTPRWKLLRPYLEDLCQDPEFKWVDRLKREAAAFAGALSAGSVETTSTARRDLSNALRTAFNQVDTTVNELCGRLHDDIQRPLAPALELLGPNGR